MMFPRILLANYCPKFRRPVIVFYVFISMIYVMYVMCDVTQDYSIQFAINIVDGIRLIYTRNTFKNIASNLL